jgi:hypothetical protein
MPSSPQAFRKIIKAVHTGKTDGLGYLRICTPMQTVDGIGWCWAKNLNAPSPPKEAQRNMVSP